MPIRLPHPEMSIALDTNIFTHWRSQQPYALTAISEYQSRMKIIPAITSFTVFEALFGREKAIVKAGKSDSQLQEKLSKANLFIQTLTVLPFNTEAAGIAAYIFPRVPKDQRTNDVYIAATIIAHRYAIATGNQRDFEIIADHLPPNYPHLYATFWKP